MIYFCGTADSTYLVLCRFDFSTILKSWFCLAGRVRGGVCAFTVYAFRGFVTWFLGVPVGFERVTTVGAALILPAALVRILMPGKAIFAKL